MSLIKRYLEREEMVNNLVAALDALLEHDMIDNDVSAGIARKITADRSVNGLSEKQLKVFDKYIQPLLEPPCEGHCGGNIDIADLPNAILSEFEEGGLCCQHCIYDNQRMREA